MKTVNMTEDEKYYYDNTEYVDERWSDYISYKDWGSGEDRTTITDDMFWQFVQKLADKMDNTKNTRFIKMFSVVD